MESKLVALTDAISRIRPGTSVGIGGMTIHRRPMAACREIVRQGIKNLTVISCYGGLAEDLLIGAGSVSTVRCGYLGLEAFGLAPNFRRLAGEGMLDIVEEGEFTIMLGLRATLLNTTFIPTKTLFWGSDQLKHRPDIKEFQCPITNERLLAVPAMRPDVAIIHVQKADCYGNASTTGQMALDIEMAYAAKSTILIAEEIVEPSEKIISSGSDVIQNVVDVVAKVPFGAHPTSCYAYYNLDVPHILKYLNASRNQESFDAYLREFVYDPKLNEDYLRKAVSSITGVMA